MVCYFQLFWYDLLEHVAKFKLTLINKIRAQGKTCCIRKEDNALGKTKGQALSMSSPPSVSEFTQWRLKFIELGLPHLIPYMK